jgi:hypothetical protein
VQDSKPARGTFSLVRVQSRAQGNVVVHQYRPLTLGQLNTVLPAFNPWLF